MGCKSVAWIQVVLNRRVVDFVNTELYLRAPYMEENFFINSANIKFSRKIFCHVINEQEEFLNTVHLSFLQESLIDQRGF
jgi:hypothetical protein